MLFLESATLLRVTLLHGCFLRFLDCTNGTKLRNASHIYIHYQNAIIWSDLISYTDFKRKTKIIFLKRGLIVKLRSNFYIQEPLTSCEALKIEGHTYLNKSVAFS